MLHYTTYFLTHISTELLTVPTYSFYLYSSYAVDSEKVSAGKMEQFILLYAFFRNVV